MNLDAAVAKVRAWWEGAKSKTRPHTWPGHPHWMEVLLRDLHRHTVAECERMRAHCAAIVAAATTPPPGSEAEPGKLWDTQALRDAIEALVRDWEARS